MTSPEEASAAFGDGEVRAAKVLFGKYELGRLLGYGACAKVYHARAISTNQSVAIKVLSKSRMSKSGLTNAVKREVSIMRRLHHPHILRLLEVLASRSRVYFVLELASRGELFSRLASRGRLPEPHARKYFHQLLSAVGYCHSRGVFHRDLKPENLLLDDADDLKVSDFGLSALLPDPTSTTLLNTICGTPAYVAPEILAKRPYAGAAADVWSCGVILFVMVAGYLPFNDGNLMAMYRKIYRGAYRCPKWVSPELRRLIGRMLETDPDKRITVDGIVHDSWFRKGMGGDEWAAMARFGKEEEEEKDGEEGREMNAFDIISFSSGLDLSGMFGKEEERERERFVAEGTPEKVVAAVEELTREEGMVVLKRKGGVVVEERESGRMVVRLEVRRLTEEVVVVEVDRGGAAADDGREAWTGEFWKERGRTPTSGSDGDRVNRVEPVG